MIKPASGDPPRTMSHRQAMAIKPLIRGNMARLTLFCGSVRSGKTWGSLMLWLLWAASVPPGAPLMMVGKTRETLRRNCLSLLAQFLPPSQFSTFEGKNRAQLFGHGVILMGAADARAESRLRGATLLGVYCDEVSLFPEEFFAMLLSRLSAPGARLFATTNPEHPGHWLKRRYLDRAAKLDLCLERFTLDDNPFLDPTYVKNLKLEYTGAFYERYILGRWVAAEGAVYPLFANNRERFLAAPLHQKTPPELTGCTIQVGVDFGGNASAFAFVAVAIPHDFSRLTALASRLLPAKGIDPETMVQHLEDFLDFVQVTYGKVHVLYADSAESTLINGLRRRLIIPVRPSRKYPILQRIRAGNMLMSQGRFAYTTHCQPLADALQNAVFAPGGGDVRLDDGSTDIDSLDAFEYSFERYIAQFTRWTPPINETPATAKVLNSKACCTFFNVKESTKETLGGCDSP